MKQISLLNFLITAALIQGCSSPVSTVKTESKELHLKRKQLYTIDIAAPVSTLNEYYQPAGSEKVYFLDPVNRSFQIFHTAEGTFRLAGVLPDLTLEWEGIFTVDEKKQKINIFYSDSIVYYSFKGDRLGMDIIPETNGFIYASSRYFPPVFKNGKLYISYFPDVEGSFKNPSHFKAPVEAEVDLASQKVKLLKQSYPVTYQKHCYSYSYQAERIEIDAVTHGYLFPNSDSIYLCNIFTGKQSVHFFGVTKRPNFAYIPFDEISSLNETALIELVKSNPQYNSLFSAPLAGFYMRELITRPKKEGDSYGQTIAVFDRELTYIGEMNEYAWLVDSKKGVLSIELNNQQILVNQLTW